MKPTNKSISQKATTVYSCIITWIKNLKSILNSDTEWCSVYTCVDIVNFLKFGINLAVNRWLIQAFNEVMMNSSKKEFYLLWFVGIQFLVLGKSWRFDVVDDLYKFSSYFAIISIFISLMVLISCVIALSSACNLNSINKRYYFEINWSST